MLQVTRHLSTILVSWLSATVLHALVLNTPSASNGFNALVTNGTATVSWTSQPSDPDTFSINIQNFVTLDSFNFAEKVSTSAGSVEGILDGVPGSPHYYLQASRIGNIFDVIANSSTFTVDGLVPSTTDSSLVPSTSPFASASFSTTFSSSIPTSSSMSPSTSPSSAASSAGSDSLGAIIGGTIGGVIIIAAIALAWGRKRRSYNNEKNNVRAHPDPPTLPVPYPLTIPTADQPISKLERYVREKREKEQKLDHLNIQKARMMEQRDKLRSEVTPNSLDGITSGTGSSSTSDTGINSQAVVGMESRLVSNGDITILTNARAENSVQTSRRDPGVGASGEARVLVDPGVQRRLNEMSQRIEELEAEKEGLTRELQESMPPPGYVA